MSWLAGWSNLTAGGDGASSFAYATWRGARDALVWELERCDMVGDGDDATLGAFEADCARAIAELNAAREGSPVITSGVQGWTFWAIPAPQALAARFAEVLYGWLSPDQWREMQRRNASPDYQAGVCASHDFCDANMAMLEAFEAVCGREPEFLSGADAAGNFTPDQEADQTLWNAAWALAHANQLRAQDGAPRPTFETMAAEFAAWLAHADQSALQAFEGDAVEMLMGADLTRAQRDWLTAFVTRWEEAEASRDFYGTGV